MTPDDTSRIAEIRKRAEYSGWQSIASMRADVDWLLSYISRVRDEAARDMRAKCAELAVPYIEYRAANWRALKEVLDDIRALPLPSEENKQ